MDTPEYFVKAHPLVEKEDLPNIPSTLRQDFDDIILTVLKVDPYELGGKMKGHVLRRPPLAGFRTIDLTLSRISYRLVYRIIESVKRVEVFSFDYHKPAYHKAEERVRNTTGYKEN